MRKLYTLTLMLLALSLLLSTQLVAQSANQAPDRDSAQQQPSQGAQQQQDMPGATSEAKTFVGKIMRVAGKLVLQDTATKTTYQLDDQDKAKQFLGKEVKVTGTLDSGSGTIHISSIEPSA